MINNHNKVSLSVYILGECEQVFIDSSQTYVSFMLQKCELISSGLIRLRSLWTVRKTYLITALVFSHIQGLVGSVKQGFEIIIWF